MIGHTVLSVANEKAGGIDKQTRGHRRQRLLSDVRRDWQLYLLALPGLAILFIYRYIPMGGLVIAFKDYSLRQGVWDSPWVGFEYFRFLFFQSPNFWQLLRNTLLINLYKLLLGFPAPIILALILNELRSLTFKKTLQTTLYLPHFVSWVVLGGIVIQFLSPNDGALNQIIRALGGEARYFLAEPSMFRGVVAVTHTLKTAGWGTIIYLAALSNVDPEQYDAATIDGASRLQQTWYVTLPGIAETIVFLLLLNVGQLLRVGFEQIYVLYNPAVYSTGDVIMTYVYRIGLGSGRFSLATAIGLFQSVVGAILLVSTNWLSKRLFDRSIW